MDVSFCLIECLKVSCFFLIANAETVITADQIVRGGKCIDLKTVVDKAVAESPCVKRVFVASRTGADVPMGKIDIPLEKVSLTGCFLIAGNVEWVELELL